MQSFEFRNAGHSSLNTLHSQRETWCFPELPLSALPSFDLGGCRVRVISGGGLKLDGGAMFGIIPKALWSRKTPSDEQNRITLACNCLLVEFDGAAGRRVVIETGHGQKFDAKESRIYEIDPAQWLLPSLHAIDVEPTTISDVIVTHLHFDHAGGLTMNGGANATPTFPHATVHVQRHEFDDARKNFGIMHATYREENFAPIDAADRWRLLEGEGPILPGIEALRTPGHTRGHQSILIRGRDRVLLFAGDVIPTRAHAGPPYNMAYDLFPLDNRDSKRRVLQMLHERSGVLLLGHEPQTPALRVEQDGEWWRLEPGE